MAVAVAARHTGSVTTPTTSHPITLPSGGSSGELLLVVFAGSGTTSTASSGWTRCGQPDPGSGPSITVFAGVVGTAGALTVATSASARSAYACFRVTGWSGLISDIRVAGATGSSITPDPPNLTPGLGTYPYLWLAVAAMNAGRLPTTAPTNYSNIQTQGTGGYSGDVGLATAERVLSAAAENPGTFSGAAATDNWDALTVAVPPPLAAPIGTDTIGFTDSATMIYTTPIAGDTVGLVDTGAMTTADICVDTDRITAFGGALSPVSTMQWRHIATSLAVGSSAEFSYGGAGPNQQVHTCQASWTNTATVPHRVYALVTRGPSKVYTVYRSILMLEQRHGVAVGPGVADPAVTVASRFGCGYNRGVNTSAQVLFTDIEERAGTRTAFLGSTVTVPVAQQVKARCEVWIVNDFWDTAPAEPESNIAVENNQGYVSGDTRVDLFAIPIL